MAFAETFRLTSPGDTKINLTDGGKPRPLHGGHPRWIFDQRNLSPVQTHYK